MSFIENYVGLFAGTPDCYAICRDWEESGEARRSYIPSDYSGDSPGAQKVVTEAVQDIGTDKYGTAAATAHCTGKHFLGVYPIHRDSTVKFFVLDFDKDEATARREAYQQQQLFAAQGLPTYLERSRSGNGYHLWGFLEEPLDAGRLRFAVSPLIVSTDTYDRMFPNQDGSTETRPYGNLIALPLYGPNVAQGRGVFLEINGEDFSPKEIPDQREFLEGVKRIPKATLEALFDKRKDIYIPESEPKLRQGDPESLAGLYKVIHPSLGCEWIRWCAENPTEVSETDWWILAAQFAQLEGGREAFHKISSPDPRYSPRNTDNKFNIALRTNAPHTCAYIRDTTKGTPCMCDKRYAAYGVKHPYDIARIPFYNMVEQLKLEQEPQPAVSGISELVQRTRQLFKNPKSFPGIPYGIPGLQDYTELRPNDLIICAARPGRGKTAFMVDLAYRIASQGTPVYVYSMEMTREQFWQRLLARAAAVDGTRLQKGKLNFFEWRRILKAERRLHHKPLPIFVDDTTNDAEEVVNNSAELIAEYGTGVVLVDYLQMATALQGETDYQKNSRIPRQYKLLAKGMGIPVFCLAQMNREGEDITEESDTIDTILEGSGKIEQYADVILYILGRRAPGIVKRTIVLHKERHREAGHRIALDFNQPIMCFEAEGTWSRIASMARTALMTSGKNFFTSTPTP